MTGVNDATRRFIRDVGTSIGISARPPWLEAQASFRPGVHAPVVFLDKPCAPGLPIQISWMTICDTFVGKACCKIQTYGGLLVTSGSRLSKAKARDADLSPDRCDGLHHLAQSFRLPNAAADWICGADDGRKISNATHRLSEGSIGPNFWGFIFPLHLLRQRADLLIRHPLMQDQRRLSAEKMPERYFSSKALHYCFIEGHFGLPKSQVHERRTWLPGKANYPHSELHLPQFTRHPWTHLKNLTIRRIPHKVTHRECACREILLMILPLIGSRKLHSGGARYVPRQRTCTLTEQTLASGRCRGDRKDGQSLLLRRQSKRDGSVKLTQKTAILT